MLFDQMVSAQGALQPVDWAFFDKQMRAAKRFSLDQKFARAASLIGRENPSSLAKIVAFARPPFPSCWFEVIYDERDWSDGEKLKPYQRDGVSRVGILIEESTKPQTYYITLCWSFRDGGTRISEIQYGWDPTGAHPVSTRGPKVVIDRWMGSDLVSANEVKIATEINYNFYAFASQYCLADIGKIPVKSDREFAMEAAKNDWNGELTFWIAVLGLINSRNVGRVVDGPDLDRINKSRVVRKERPLFSYSRCVLTDKVAQHIGRRSSPDGLRAHFVRGHFKARKSGIYWWSPFMRGDRAAGMVEKDYAVV